MKQLFICLLLSCLPVWAWGQSFTLPTNPNKIDAKGLRQGAWTILYDKDWKVINDEKGMEFFRIITYKDDKPLGTVKDHYKNGVVQMEATLLADRPEEVMDGLVVFYDVTGKKEKESIYKNGKVESEKSFIDENSYQGLNNQGIKLYQEGKYKEAVAIFEKTKIQAEKEFGKLDLNYAESCNNLAILYQNQALYVQAESLFIEAKNIREKKLGVKHQTYAEACNNLAFLYQEQGLYKQAEPLYIEAKNITEKILGKGDTEYARFCNNLASLYDTQGLYPQAEPLYIEAKNIIEKNLGKKHSDYARFCNNLGVLYKNQGLYAKAEPLYIEAKNIWEEVVGKEHSDFAEVCNNLSVLYQDQGLYAQAEPLCVQAKNIWEKVFGKNNPKYAVACNNLASLYELQDLYKQAEPLYIETRQIIEAIVGKENVTYAAACNNLGDLYRKQKLYAQAEPLYLEAKSIFEKTLGKNHANYAQSCNNLAFIYDKQNLYAQAETLYIEAKNSQEKNLGKEHPHYAQFCSNLGTLYGKQNLYNQVEPLYIEITQIILNQIKRNFVVLSEKEKGIYYNNIVFQFELFNSFAIKRYKENPSISEKVYNNTLSTKALLFHTNNKIRERIMNSKDESLKELYKAWKDKKEFLAKLYTLTIEERQKDKVDLVILEKEVNDLEKQLSQKSELFAKTNDNIMYSWKDVQKKLKAKEIAIEIVRLDIYDKEWTDSVKYIALIVKPSSKYPEMIVLNNGNELEGKYAKNYQNCIKGKANDKYSYTQYWSSINEKLKGVKKVYLSVDGVYNSINLNTLKNPETGKYVGEEVEIQLVSNTKDIVLPTALSAKEKEKNGAVLIGFPDYNNKSKAPKSPSLEDKKVVVDSTQRFFDGSNISELVGTKTEVENIEKMLQKAKIVTQSYTEGQASEGMVKKLDSPYILHIATHGFFMKDVEKSKEDERGLMGMDSKTVFENPLLRAGLLLANAKEALQEGGDGVLTAYEAMNLNLDNTDLVVMSACETGLGEVRNGEGVYGLQRAFQTAGAKTVLMSLWTVSDEATQELMTLFYENLIIKKESKREAFRNAQNELKKKFPQPYYWGAFVMVGE